jgi:deoxycytidine triphosphate deaminase
MLKNLKKENVRAASVDLQLGDIFTIASEGTVDLENDQWPVATPQKLPYILKPGEYVLARTIEEIDQPDEKYGCLLGTRSRAFRIGLSVQANYFGPYYKGKIVFGIHNVSKNPVKLYVGMSLVHLVFLEINGETKEFTHDFQFGRVL